LLMTLLVACAKTGAATNGQASGTRSAAPSAPATTASGSPRGSADLPITTVGFSCSLPVTFHQGAGFVTFPAATLKPDPSAALEVADSSQPIYRTVAQPHLYGRGGAMFYDRARSRWVPAPREAVSTDGARYAYATGDPNAQKLHVVEVATGADRVIDLVGFPFVAVVLDFAPAGIYLISGYEGPSVGPVSYTHLTLPTICSV